jgi:hypothetical protein
MTRISLDPLSLTGDLPSLVGFSAEWTVQNDGVTHLRGHGIEVGAPFDLEANTAGIVHTVPRGACMAMEKAITGRDLPFNEHAPILHPGVRDYWAGEWPPSRHSLKHPTQRATIRRVSLTGANGSSSVAIAAFYVQSLVIDDVVLDGELPHIMLVGCDRVTVRGVRCGSIGLNSCTRVRVEDCTCTGPITVEEACADVDVVRCEASHFRSGDTLCRFLRLTDCTFSEPNPNPGAIQLAGGRNIRVTRCHWPATSHAWSDYVPAKDFLVRDCTHTDGTPIKEPARYHA